PSPGSYLTLSRTWNDGDRVELHLPMYLHIEAMPDEPATQALLYGPLVLAGRLGSDGLDQQMIVGPMGPDLKKHPMAVPQFRASGPTPDSWIKPLPGQTLTFRTTGQQTDVTLVAF